MLCLSTLTQLKANGATKNQALPKLNCEDCFPLNYESRTCELVASPPSGWSKCRERIDLPPLCMDYLKGVHILLFVSSDIPMLASYASGISITWHVSQTCYQKLYIMIYSVLICQQ